MAARGTYLVKEMFGPTVQGEGSHAGRACVFLRFAACNLACTWCDTDFSPDGASRLRAPEIAECLLALDRHGARMVVVTGGEPTLQWDEALRASLAVSGFRIHMESNGTRPLAAPVDWLTVSPKPRFHGRGDRLLGPDELAIDECKVVVDETVTAETLAIYEKLYPGAVLFLQPCAPVGGTAPLASDSLARTIGLVTERPRWRLTLQIHKLVGLP